MPLQQRCPNVVRLLLVVAGSFPGCVVFQEGASAGDAAGGLGGDAATEPSDAGSGTVTRDGGSGSSGSSARDAGGQSSSGPADAGIVPDAAHTTSHAPVIDFGYYRVDTTPAGGGSAATTVNAWTNLAYADWSTDARAFDVAPGGDVTQVMANMDGILYRLTSAGLGVMMDLSYGNAWGPRLTKQGILSTAAPYWSHVRYLVLGDELTLTRAEADAAMTELRTAMVNLGLADRPIGVTLTPEFVLQDPAPDLLLASWDFVNLEAYSPACSCGACGTGTAQAETAAVAAQLVRQEARIPATAALTLVMQGYDRNGAFTNHGVLAALNRATYFDMVKGNPRYLAIVVFNWQREGSACASNPAPQWGHGTSGLPALQVVHQEIWRDLTTGTTWSVMPVPDNAAGSSGGGSSSSSSSSGGSGGPPYQCTATAMTECGGAEGPPGVWGCCSSFEQQHVFGVEVEQSINQFQSEHPEMFSGDNVLDEDGYVQGVAAILGRDHGLCSQQGGPADEIGVKADNTMNEQYDILSAQGTVVRTNQPVTCRPARF